MTKNSLMINTSLLGALSFILLAGQECNAFKIKCPEVSTLKRIASTDLIGTVDSKVGPLSFTGTAPLHSDGRTLEKSILLQSTFKAATLTKKTTLMCSYQLPKIKDQYYKSTFFHLHINASRNLEKCKLSDNKYFNCEKKKPS